MNENSSIENEKLKEKKEKEVQRQHQSISHGINPQSLIEKILRNKIFDSPFYKEQCFGLNAESLVDKATDLKYIGSFYGGTKKPTPFIILLFKMLRIGIEKSIILTYLRQKHFKYLTILAAFYLRMTGSPIEIFQELEPLYNDYRKIVIRHSSPKILNAKEKDISQYEQQDQELIKNLENQTKKKLFVEDLSVKKDVGKTDVEIKASWFDVTTMDQIIEEMLTKNYVWDITLPHLPKRSFLEDLGLLDKKRPSLLDYLPDNDVVKIAFKDREQVQQQRVQKAREQLLNGPKSQPEEEKQETEEEKKKVYETFKLNLNLPPKTKKKSNGDDVEMKEKENRKRKRNEFEEDGK